MNEASQERPTARALAPRLFLGTSSWSSADWEGVFYPEGTAAGDYLAHYARRYRTVECDATFYRTPAASTVRKWRSILPEGFVMAAKVPQVITHEKSLAGCHEEMDGFVRTMALLEDRLGPLLLQFPYFSKSGGMTLPIFLERLTAFLPSLPSDRRFALEVRNKGWIQPPLLELLRAHGVALALIDHPWMTPIEKLLQEADLFTADFCYVRWLGDRKGIEARTTSWDKVIVDRSREMARWVPAVREMMGSGRTVYGYFNNHYAGHAPGSIALFEKLWAELK